MKERYLIIMGEINQKKDTINLMLFHKSIYSQNFLHGK